MFWLKYFDLAVECCTKVKGVKSEKRKSFCWKKNTVLVFLKHIWALFDLRWQSCPARERDLACKAFRAIFSSPPLSPPQSHRCRKWVGEALGEQEEEEQGAALEQEQERIDGKGGKGSSYFFTLTSLTSSFWTDWSLFYGTVLGQFWRMSLMFCCNAGV